MQPRLIKTEADNEAALARIAEIFDAKPGTPEGDELELLVTLVELFEQKAYPIALPDPIAAIRFRMEQQGLKAKDMIAYLGSASKVSEVLSGKRPLSLAMIRNLVNKLGIPADVFLREPETHQPDDEALCSARNFPVAEMVKRGWFAGFQGTVAEAKNQLDELLKAFLGPFGPDAMIHCLNRQHVRDGSQQDRHALTAWRIRVAHLALRESLPAYSPGVVTEDFLRELARLSYLNSGPLLAREFLNKSGIHLICERHLPKTHLDGGVMKLPNGSPVVALTLRYDRLDNFWFTLFHELAHLALHLDQNGIDAFFDDLTAGGEKDRYEQEADKLAAETLIPDKEWTAAHLSATSSSKSVEAFAEQLRINPAIAAGRIRFEANDYTVFRHLVGSGKVRTMFDPGSKG
ncbi:MAG: ImmA/IrrE family metallo-endopeptidase [Clostridia bacterium]|nr:ImmA/IrrE family metallo-endopeptidase [Clostridia bacterium]